MTLAIREICVAGSTIDFCLKIPPTREDKKRAPKTNITPEDVWEVNRKNAEKTLARILNHNFVPGDWHLVFTYEGTEPTQQKAKKDREKLCRQLTADGLKWVAVTEYKHERIHHHIVVQFMPFEYFTNIWEYGDVRPTKMKRNRSYRKLANYLIKETSKTYREEGSAFRRRYSYSKNIVKPQPYKEDIFVSDIYAEPKPWKGYYIDRQSIRRYENKLTGTPQLEYTMIAIDEKPRIKKWYKGTKILRSENYNHLLRTGRCIEQMQMDLTSLSKEACS